MDDGDGDAEHRKMAAGMLNSSCGGRLSRLAHAGFE